MAGKRTRYEIARDIALVRKCTQRLSGEILSIRDVAENVGLSKSQLNYTFNCMDKEEVWKIKNQLNFLEQVAKKTSSYVTLNFPKNTMLGIDDKHTKCLFIDSVSLNSILKKGKFNPRKDDIIYFIERRYGKIFFKKSLVLSVEVNRRALKVKVLTIIREKFPESKKNWEILLLNDMLDGIDCYVLSIF